MVNYSKNSTIFVSELKSSYIYKTQGLHSERWITPIN